MLAKSFWIVAASLSAVVAAPYTPVNAAPYTRIEYIVEIQPGSAECVYGTVDAIRAPNDPNPRVDLFSKVLDVVPNDVIFTPDRSVTGRVVGGLHTADVVGHDVLLEIPAEFKSDPANMQDCCRLDSKLRYHVFVGFTRVEIAKRQFDVQVTCGPFTTACREFFDEEDTEVCKIEGEVIQAHTTTFP
ncbi:uncharacterized protein L969DRAFT_48776 [Mixia osmundae IAM 14324]|uniref:Phosphatidylglycerol/phosphatidylinositol transfer protein n=1 Tax=Mixia osmundae (strain CBS 9802 / IAM 14324 / JCM 22182 / KY 12970) TaxID=764103 RepID=G7DZQ9_MIXOS|nr:uncharacterized protein L969DRAFT_48776 [Mixia osmundae IAM 14324]KEI39272.1 hypothetical protein L969DRAFT_48776 [Mixia osmundae IAM 14324]GAA96069.1 hypothetical protein E5Q_02730 [Mixia osmundae IAM 14324]